MKILDFRFLRVLFFSSSTKDERFSIAHSTRVCLVGERERVELCKRDYEINKIYIRAINFVGLLYVYIFK